MVATEHDWGSGRTFAECRSQGLTDYGPKTGQRWVGDFYANLYDCTAPTTLNWGWGSTFAECRSQGRTVFGRVTGRRWVGGFYANLYYCTSPPHGPLPPGSYSSPEIQIAELSVRVLSSTPHVFRPRFDLPPWDAALPLDWAADPFEDRNWQFQLHSWISMDHWLNASQQGELTGLEEMIAIALDWERFHIRDRQESAFQWYDMATGFRASRLAFLLDNVFMGNVEVSDADLNTLMGLAELHVAILLRPWFLSHGNHGLFQIAGLNALCEVISWRKVCEGAASYARESLAKLLGRWFTDQGVHRENSPFYHGFTLTALERLRVPERIQLPEVGAIIERAEMVSPWLTYPDGRWVPVGDTAGRGPPLSEAVQPHCLGDDRGCWAVADLTESGYAVIRSMPEAAEGGSLLFISAMGDAIAHKHADDLGFVLMEGGREIFVDSGKYGYNKDELRSYVISARAHNIPSLVGRPIGPRDIDADGTHLKPIRTTASGFIIEGVADRPDLLLLERAFTYLPGTSLRIEDRLRNRTGLGWQSNLHLAPDLEPVLTASGFEVRVEGMRVEAVFEGEGCELDMVRGETDPHQGWVSAGYLQMTPGAVVRATCPSDLVESAWHITFHR